MKSNIFVSRVLIAMSNGASNASSAGDWITYRKASVIILDMYTSLSLYIYIYTYMYTNISIYMYIYLFLCSFLMAGTRELGRSWGHGGSKVPVWYDGSGSFVTCDLWSFGLGAPRHDALI